MIKRWTLSLLALLPLSAFAAGGGSANWGGVTSVALGTAQPSFLGIDLAELEEGVCGASGPGRGAVLVILNDGGGYAAASLSVNVISVTAGPGPGQLLAWVQPTYFSAVGPEPVEFWCGRFSYRLQLNNHVIQPISALNLISNSASGTGGTCSGVLTLEIWLEFTPASIGPTVRVARTLKLDITGRWTLLDTGRTFPGTSPLLLFAESRAEGTVADPVWVGGDDPNTWLYFEGPVVAGPPSF